MHAPTTAPERPPRAPASSRLGGYLGLIALLTATAAALRFATIDVQSYWHDEALTATLVKMPFGDMLSQLPKAELTPPLYYLLLWPWQRVFGSSEVALRSFSALAGIATVPVAYAAGRELVSRRVGFAIAALAAFSPLLVWYSQEARPYSLLVLLGALSFLFFARALRRRSGRELAWWATTSILALLVHYFAAFLIVPEGLYLAWTWRPRRPALTAGGSVALAGLALVPLARAELAHGSTSYIGAVSLHRRVLGVPEDFLTGFVIKWDTPVEKVLDGVAIAIAVVAVWLLVRGADAAERRASWLAAAAALIAAGVPALLSIAGWDLLNTRNVIVAWLPAMLVVAIGFARRGVPRAVGVAGVAALCAIGVAASTITQADPIFHRSEFRASAHALGPARVPRALAVPVAIGPSDYALYLQRLDPLPARGADVAEIDVVTPRNPKFGASIARPSRLAAPPPGFHLVERRYDESFTLLRYRARAPRRVTAASVASVARPVMPIAALLVQLPGR